MEDFHEVLREATPRVFITPILLACNAIVYVAMVASGVSILDPTIEELLDWGANFGPYILSGEAWRLLSAAFIHIGIVHFLFNMWCLLSLGMMAERMFGNWTFLVLYLASGLGGSLASVWWNPVVVSAGASGAIFGIAGGMIAFLFIGRIAVPLDKLQSHFSSILFFAGYNLYYGMQHPGIDNAGHIGGLVMGLALGACLLRSLPPPETYSRVRYALIFVAVALVLGAGGIYVTGEVNHKEVYLEIGNRHFEAGDFEEAATAYVNALTLDPNFVSAHNNLGIIHLNRKNYKSAVISFSQAVRLDPGNVQMRFFLGEAYLNNGQPGDAFFEFQKVAAREPGNVDAHLGLGRSSVATGRYQEAVAAYEKVLGAGVDHVEVYIALGYAYGALEKYYEAMDAFEKALAVDSSSVEARHGLGHIYRQRGRYEDAVAAFEQTLKQAPSDSYYELGQTYATQNRYDEAIAAYKKTIALEPTYLNAHGSLGWIYYVKGEFENCIKFSEMEVLLNPDALYARFNIPLAYLCMGQAQKARVLYSGTMAYCRQHNLEPLQGAMVDLKRLIDGKIQAQEARRILKEVFELSDREIYLL